MNPINQVLEFVVRHYPVSVYPRVLEIAAGSGRLSCLLAHRGYQVTAMDPNLKVEKDVGYSQMVTEFNESTDISQYDLGIAIHPCDIHELLIKKFEDQNKALFLLPCVTFACDSYSLSKYKDNDEWLQYLEQYGSKLKKVELLEGTVPYYLQPFCHAFYSLGSVDHVHMTSRNRRI